MCRCAAAYAASAPAEATLQVDCEIEASLLTEENVRGLYQLEPCGAGCPKPVLQPERPDRRASSWPSAAASICGCSLQAPDGIARAAPFSSRPRRSGGKAPPRRHGSMRPLRRRSTNSAAVRTRAAQSDRPAPRRTGRTLTMTALYLRALAGACAPDEAAGAGSRPARTSSRVWRYPPPRGPQRRGAAGRYCDRLCLQIARVLSGAAAQAARRAIACLDDLCRARPCVAAAQRQRHCSTHR